MGLDERKHPVMSLLIRRDDQPAAGVKRVPVQIAQHATGGLTQRDAGSEVDVVSEPSV